MVPAVLEELLEKGPLRVRPFQRIQREVSSTWSLDQDLSLSGKMGDNVDNLNGNGHSGNPSF